jgi:hypothetical protein
VAATNGNELLRRLKRYCRRNGLAFSFDPSRGKGGHGEIEIEGRTTILRSARSKKLPTGTLYGLLRQLGVNPEDMDLR